MISRVDGSSPVSSSRPRSMKNDARGRQEPEQAHTDEHEDHGHPPPHVGCREGVAIAHFLVRPEVRPLNSSRATTGPRRDTSGEALVALR